MHRDHLRITNKSRLGFIPACFKLRPERFTSDKKNLIFLIFIFFIAQFAYHFAHAGFFSAFSQLDFVVNTRAIFSVPHHFWQSIFYYHLAPPLYVAYASGFYKIFPPNGEMGFYILHTILGLYAIYTLYMIQKKLEINGMLATFFSAVFILSPSFNLIQSTPFYDFPTACLLIISAWHLSKLLNRPKFFNAFNFFAIIALVCSIRSLYHVLIYLLPLILMTCFVLKIHWKMILIASLLPFFFVLFPYVKNAILFDTFSTSSYFGETLDSISMQFYVTLKEREEGIKKGFFSEMALCPSTPESSRTPSINSKYSGWYCYASLADKFREAYIKKLALAKILSNIPVLSCERYQTGTKGLYFPERSCLGNIGMSLAYQKNALQAIWHYPNAYRQGILGALRQYFNTHVSFYYEIMTSRHLPQTLQWSLLRFPLYDTPDLTLSISVPLLIVFPLLCFFAICFILYTRKGIYYCLSAYLGALGCTLLLATHYIGHANFIAIFHHWNLQANLIIYLLTMFIIMSAIALLGRFYLFILEKQKKMNALLSSFIYPQMTYHKRILVLYLLCTILFTSLVIIFLVGIAQQRYRIYIDGLYLILFSLLIQTLFFKPANNAVDT